MNYSKEEVKEYIEQEDVKFVRLAFCDINGKQKNVSIMPSELPRAFEQGIALDSSSIKGFDDFTDAYKKAFEEFIDEGVNPNSFYGYINGKEY